MSQAGLIAPHGGTLVNRTTDDPAALKAKAQGLPAVALSAADLSTVYRIADGTLTEVT